MKKIDSNKNTIGRRDLLKGSLVGAGSFALATSTTAHANINIEPEEIEVRKHEIVRRLRYRQDAGYLLWWFKGPMMAQQGADLVPMMELVHCAISLLEPTSDGGFEMVGVEIPFRTDLHTGERLTKYFNPMTKEEIDIPFSTIGPSKIKYNAKNELQMPEKIGGSDIEYKAMGEDLYVTGDTIMLTHHGRSQVSTPGKTDRIITEYTTISGPLDRALDANENFAPATAASSDVTGFARWLQTPAEFGNQSLRAIGQKVEKVEQLPAQWRKLLHEVDPELAKNPLKALDREEAKYLS